MQTTKKVQCPKCHRMCDRGLSLHYCTWCQMCFDDSPEDDGGDYDDRNPAARLEREERRERNKRYPRR